MIDFGRILLVGRHESLSDEKRVLLARLTPMLARATDAMRERWPDRLDAWERWNVAAWHVEGTVLNRLDLLTFDGLGVRPLPHLVERWTYVVNLHHIDPLAVPGDPPLLHRSSRLLDESQPVPGKDGKPVTRPQEWRSRVECIRLLEDALERESILDAPQGQTARGMEMLLRWKGLQIQAHKNGWRLRQISDDERMSFGVQGTRLDEVVPRNLAGNGPRGLTIVEASASTR